MKITHVITCLGDGGAQSVLYNLCKHDQRNNHQVVSLSGDGKYGPMFASIGVDVRTLNLQGALFPLLGFFKLALLLRREKPHVVQTWMYHADLVGGLAARAAGIKPVVWGLHNFFDSTSSKTKTIIVVRLLSKLSWLIPAKILSCSKRVIDNHVSMGYDRTKIMLAYNGYDLANFQPVANSRDLFTASLPATNLNHGDLIPLIGTVGRFHPDKDYVNLLDALVVLRELGFVFKCVLVGTELDRSNTLLAEWIAKRGLADCIELLGPRTDIPRIMNSIDIFVLPSAREAFPNVVAEAMACGTPCVVTDVGDVAYMVGDTGWVVPPKNPQFLANGLAHALDELSIGIYMCSRSRRARQRIEQNFSIGAMVHEYINCWNSVL